MTSKKELIEELGKHKVQFINNFNNTGIIVTTSKKAYDFCFTADCIRVYTNLGGAKITFKAITVEIEIEIDGKAKEYLSCSDKNGSKIDLYI